MSKLKELIKSPYIHVALATGFSIIVMAFVSKRILPEPIEKLREDTQLSQIPIIIISSLSQDDDVLKGLEKGAVDYIPKPFSPQILIAKIKKYSFMESYP